MAICEDCANKRYCTFPRTDSTQFCDEYDDTLREPEKVEWDLNSMLADWGYKAPEKS